MAGPSARPLGVIGVVADQKDAALIAAAQAGDPAAMDRLVRANLGLLYEGVHQAIGTLVDHDEYLSAAFEGLLLALRTFDPSKGELTTWAMIAMKQRVKSEHHRRKTAILVPMLYPEMSAERREAAVRAKRMHSLEAPRAGDEGKRGATLMDRLAARMSDRDDRQGYADRLAEVMRELGKLDHRDRDVLIMRIRGDRFIDIAAAIGVSKQRAQQIAERAVRTLRSNLGMPTGRLPGWYNTRRAKSRSCVAPEKDAPAAGCIPRVETRGNQRRPAGPDRASLAGSAGVAGAEPLPSAAGRSCACAQGSYAGGLPLPDGRGSGAGGHS